MAQATETPERCDHCSAELTDDALYGVLVPPQHVSATLAQVCDKGCYDALTANGWTTPSREELWIAAQRLAEGLELAEQEEEGRA